MIDCPYCLTPQSFSRGDNCESCGKKVPRQYIEIARVKPPIWIVTYGPPQHGKSTLLGSLTFLMERLGTIAPRSFHTYLDDFTQKRVAEIQRGQHIGRANLGATVKQDKPEPLLIALKNFPTPTESQIFVIFDLAGEVVDEIANRVMDDSSEPPLYARAVAKAKTVWFVISLYDMQRDIQETGKSINNLFFAYQQTMAQLNLSMKNRDILVIYSKADLLGAKDDINLLELTNEIYDYIDTDPNADLGNRGASKPPVLVYEEYSTQLERLSNQLEGFTQDEVPGGSAFVAMTEDSEAKLYFTINSAQGSASGTSGTHGTQMTRHRVLDPLLWTIRLNDSSGETSAALILPTRGARQVYTSDMPVSVFNALRSHSLHASTYYMGDRRPAFLHAPTDLNPPSNRVEVVGTILDQLKKDNIVVVLTDDVLPLDIDDFADTSWDNRLLLLGTNKNVMGTRVRWKYQVQTVGEIDQIIREFARHLEMSRVI